LIFGPSFPPPTSSLDYAAAKVLAYQDGFDEGRRYEYEHSIEALYSQRFDLADALEAVEKAAETLGVTPLAVLHGLEDLLEDVEDDEDENPAITLDTQWYEGRNDH
jgi:hypothetical protein